VAAVLAKSRNGANKKPFLFNPFINSTSLSLSLSLFLSLSLALAQAASAHTAHVVATPSITRKRPALTLLWLLHSIGQTPLLRTLVQEPTHNAGNRALTAKLAFNLLVLVLLVLVLLVLVLLVLLVLVVLVLLVLLLLVHGAMILIRGRGHEAGGWRGHGSLVLGSGSGSKRPLPSPNHPPTKGVLLHGICMRLRCLLLLLLLLLEVVVLLLLLLLLKLYLAVQSLLRGSVAGWILVRLLLLLVGTGGNVSPSSSSALHYGLQRLHGCLLGAHVFSSLPLRSLLLGKLIDEEAILRLLRLLLLVLLLLLLLELKQLLELLLLVELLRQLR
jgi:hypothetical protein